MEFELNRVKYIFIGIVDRHNVRYIDHNYSDEVSLTQLPCGMSCKLNKIIDTNDMFAEELIDDGFKYINENYSGIDLLMKSIVTNICI